MAAPPGRGRLDIVLDSFPGQDAFDVGTEPLERVLAEYLHDGPVQNLFQRDIHDPSVGEIRRHVPQVSAAPGEPDRRCV